MPPSGGRILTVYALSGILLTLITGFALARLLPLAGLLDRLIAGGVLCVSSIVANAWLLSAIGPYFNRLGLLSLGAVEAVLAGWLVARSPRAVSSLAADARRSASGTRALPRAAVRHPVVAVLSAFLGVLYCWRTFAGVAIGVRDYDGLWYHLVTTMAFVHAHRVGIRIPVNLYSDSYAPNIEIITAWGVVLQGTSLLAAVTQVPFAFLGAGTTAAIGRRCGLTRASSLMAGCLFLLTPIVIDQVSRQYNDIATAVLLLAGMHLAGTAVTGTRLAARETAAYVALTGITLGLAVGSKASTLAAAAVLSLAVVVMLARCVRRGTMPARLAGQAVLGGAAGLLLLGAPYYVRDFVLFGNPLQPFSYRLGPIHFHGPLDIRRDLVGPFLVAAGRPGDPPGPLFVLQVWAGHPGVPGQPAVALFGFQWFVLWPCLALVAIWATVRRRHGYFLLLVAACLTSVVVQPVAWWGRYTIYVVAPAAVAAMWLLDGAARHSRTARMLSEVGVALLAAVAVWPLPARFWVAPAGVPTSGYGVGTARNLTAPEVVRDVVHGRRPVIERAPQYRWLRDAPPGSRTLVTPLSPYFVGPLYGPDGSHWVVLVDARTPPRNLDRVMAGRGIGYAWLRDREPLGRYASSHPAQFQVVGKGGGAVVFRLLHPSSR